MTLTPDYAELLKAKHFLSITHDNQDDNIALYVAASSRAIDNHCHRPFGKLTAPVSLSYKAWYDPEARLWSADIHDIYSTEGLAVTVAGTAVTEYDLKPQKAPLKDKPWERIVFRATAERQPTGKPDEVAVLGLPGWVAIPKQVELACLLQVSRLNSRPSSPFGVAGSPQAGGEHRLLERLDPDVAVNLKSVVRRWLVA